MLVGTGNHYLGIAAIGIKKCLLDMVQWGDRIAVDHVSYFVGDYIQTDYPTMSPAPTKTPTLRPTLVPTTSPTMAPSTACFASGLGDVGATCKKSVECCAGLTCSFKTCSVDNGGGGNMGMMRRKVRRR